MKPHRLFSVFVLNLHYRKEGKELSPRLVYESTRPISLSQADLWQTVVQIIRRVVIVGMCCAKTDTEKME